jgi:hypothetical protein
MLGRRAMTFAVALLLFAAALLLLDMILSR